MLLNDRSCWLCLGWLLLASAAVRAQSPTTPELSDKQLAHHVRSILSNRCFACHGPDEAMREAGLRLDEPLSLLRPTVSGSSPVVPGQPQLSELWLRITSSDESLRMPPADFGARLLPQEIADIEAWISQGAQLPQHWSFVAPTRPALPQPIAPPTALTAVVPASRGAVTSIVPSESRLWDSQHPVDRFILAAQQSNGIQPSPPATAAELLRRLSLDLTGLPPTLAELAAFERDDSADAYERQVERLLASPAFGEHWARKWLDLARYADSSGYADDPARTIWAYRDWVIDALNENLSVEQFTLEQLAGDLLPQPSQPQWVATAFHRNTLTNNEGGTNDEEFRSVAIVDRVNTTLAVWMGVTMGCAQCHTHKYDPFTQHEYFQLYDIFNQSADADRRDESPLVDVFTPAQREQQAELDQRIEQIESQLSRPSAQVLANLETWAASLVEPQWTSLQPAKLVSDRGSDVRIDEDRSIHVRPTANNIVSDSYTVTLHTATDAIQPIAALAIRTLPAADLPAGGAGTGSGGKFVVTGLSATIVSTRETNDADERPPRPRKINFTAAYADYQQAGFEADKVIDQDKASGWAVGGDAGQSHLLMLIPSRTIRLYPDDRLQLRIDHNSSHRHHLLGSFQVQWTTTDNVADWGQLDQALKASVRLPPPQRSPAQVAQLQMFYSRYIAPEHAHLRSEMSQLQRKLTALKPVTTVPVMRQLPSDARRQTHVQLRGNYKSLGDQVHAGVPAVFHPLPESAAAPDRLALAQWLVDRRNPLTARVWVNRLWEALFGIGIVRTSEEFGSQGDRPTHPELLDWLACELMEQQWDTKRMLRLLVTSQSYRQTSRIGTADFAVDPENVWLGRGPRVRLSAEMVRDQALHVAGLLSAKMHGPPVRPPQPNLGLKAAFGSETDWRTSEGEDRYRRGIYTTWRRSNPYPSMATFDAPSREVCTLRRDSTNTPLQALVTLNDPGFVEAAQGLARRVALHQPTDSHRDDRTQLQLAFQLCTARAAQPRELETLLKLLHAARGHFANDPAAAKLLATDPLGPLENAFQEIEMAAWTSVCNVLLNLDEVLMKR